MIIHAFIAKGRKGALGFFLLAAFLAPSAQATEANLNARIMRTLATGDDSFGGCMAYLNVSLAEETGLDCPDQWVTFSCSGEHADRHGAARMFDSAQMALVTGWEAQLWVDDARKNERGHCFASRIDVIADDE